MQQTSTYQQLLIIERDIQKQSQYSPAFAVFNANKIKDFYQRNQMHLKVANEKLNAMMEDHIAKDEEGKWRTEEKDGSKFFVCKTDEDYNLYKEKYDALMARNVTIVI